MDQAHGSSASASLSSAVSPSIRCYNKTVIAERSHFCNVFLHSMLCLVGRSGPADQRAGPTREAMNASTLKQQQLCCYVDRSNGMLYLVGSFASMLTGTMRYSHNGHSVAAPGSSDWCCGVRQAAVPRHHCRVRAPQRPAFSAQYLNSQSRCFGIICNSC